MQLNNFLSSNIKITKLALKWVIIILAIIAFLIWWAVGSTLPRHSKLTIHQSANGIVQKAKSTLKVVTYNIAHGQGFKNHASDWRDENRTRQKMTEVTTALKTIDADVVFLQEVDLNSNRTHRIDQAKWLVDALGYSYWACAPIWEKNYVPYPFWPIKHHIGEVKTANCILSKYPLSNHERFVFDKPQSNPFWFNWGYIDRGAQRVNAQIFGKIITLVNIHFEDQDEEAREKQAKDMVLWLKTSKDPLVLGGDFNAPLHDTAQKSNLADDSILNYKSDETLKIVLDAFQDETLDIALNAQAANKNAVFTFPSHAPNRKIDHLFALNGAKVISGRVVTEAGDASDHLPVLIEIEY